MLEYLVQYEKKPPEIIFEWKDPETTATGWLVIDSLINGAAGGGTRLREGLDKQEVIALAKTMSLKFKAIEMPIGGAKAGINFNPASPLKNDVLKRWFKAIRPILKSYYGTGGDLNVDKIKDIIPNLKELGILHPQEGIINGYFRPSAIEKKQLINRLKVGVSKVIDDPKFTPDRSHQYKIADMATGFGIAEAIKAFYNTYHNDGSNKTVFIQGWGNVGAAAGFFLTKSGFKINVIVDLQGALVKEEGFTQKEITHLFVNKRDFLSQNIGKFISPNEIEKKVWDIKTNIFVPAAASKLVIKKHIDHLLQNGLELIAPGANVPFKDNEIFYGPICQYVDKQISLIPDFISNCGMAETFWYLMRTSSTITDKAIFTDISKTIKKLFRKAYKTNKNRTLLMQIFLQTILR